MTEEATFSPAPAQGQTHAFQAETKQVLRLVIHSLYSHKEIFLRELVSNAADAIRKRGFEALSNPSASLPEGQEDAVTLALDKTAGTLTISDTGIGLTAAEAQQFLGSIASSGTKRFVESLSGDQAKDSQLIGQFGVGFYSAFIVADKVTVVSKRAGGNEPGIRWESDGEGEYTLAEDTSRAGPGTDVILHIRDEDKEFLDAHRVRALVKQYSEHIGIPIKLVEEPGKEPETINQPRAFWTRPKSELTDEDYQAFYRTLTSDWAPAATWSHFKVEGNLEYTGLLYLPTRADPDAYHRDRAEGIRLYVKRVFIMDKAAELLPPWLRFMRGLVDSNDLPLNVSRELLQNSRTVDRIRTALVKRTLDLLEDLATNQPEKYAEFWKNFGVILKEGVIEGDDTQRERVAKLLRFASTLHPDGATVTLPDYVSRMKEGQKAIYALTADTAAQAAASPHLEAFRAKGIEVLLLSDRVDEWLLGHLTEFDGKEIESASRGTPEDLEDDTTQADGDDADKTKKDDAPKAPVLEKLQTYLGDKVSEVRASRRLTESAAVLVAPDMGLSLRMERMLKAAGQGGGMMGFGPKPVFEVNLNHPLLARLGTAEAETFDDLAGLLYDQAVLAEGGQLADPANFARRLNRLLAGVASSVGTASRTATAAGAAAVSAEGTAGTKDDPATHVEDGLPSAPDAMPDSVNDKPIVEETPPA